MLDFKLIKQFFVVYTSSKLWGFLPTVLRIGSYRFYFYSHEPNEPPHIHIDRDGCSTKFWLRKVALADNLGFGKKELNELNKMVSQHQQYLLDQWHGYFGTQNR
jgi:hypothetical protein